MNSGRFLKSGQSRWYRNQFHSPDLSGFTLTQGETDLWIAIPAKHDIPSLRRFCQESLSILRRQLEHFLTEYPDFGRAFSPVTVPAATAPLIHIMAAAAQTAQVGPMAAVAGAFAACLGEQIQRHFGLTDLLIENGGDIFLSSRQERHIAIHAGSSPLSGKVALRIAPGASSLGICTSSATVGHSFSFGRADAITVLSENCAAADAYATALGNLVKAASDIQPVLALAQSKPEIKGCLIILGETLGAIGEVELCPLPASRKENSRVHP